MSGKMHVMDNKKKLGQRISEIRKIKNITQEGLVERSDLTLSYISKIEAGKKNPTMAVIDKIAFGLGVETYQLFTSLETELMNNKTILDRIEKLVITLKERN